MAAWNAQWLHYDLSFNAAALCSGYTVIAIGCFYVFFRLGYLLIVAASPLPSSCGYPTYPLQSLATSFFTTSVYGVS
jgi:hypothetical protein